VLRLNWSFRKTFIPFCTQQFYFGEGQMLFDQASSAQIAEIILQPSAVPKMLNFLSLKELAIDVEYNTQIHAEDLPRLLQVLKIVGSSNEIRGGSWPSQLQVLHARNADF